MGFHMASNLLRAGLRLVVYDTNDAAADRLSAMGASISGSPAQLAATPGMDAMITMLPGPSAVEEVYCGAGGVLSAAGGVRARLMLDCSTIDPPTARRVAEAAEASPLHPEVEPVAGWDRRSPVMVDAPVSGGEVGAQGATLTFMCGGAPAAFSAAQPLLSLMGSRSIHCGGPSTGQAAKLCNNLVLAVSMAGIAEGLSLGRRLGLDPALLSSVFNSSSARCWAGDSYNPCPGVMEGVPASRGYSGGFSAAIMLKDLRLAATAAEACAAPLHMGRTAEQLYKQVDQDADFGAVFRDIYALGIKFGNKPGKPTEQ